MSEELKPCPFCGEEGPYIVNDNTGMYVLCPNCMAQLYDQCSLTGQQLIAKWNRRAYEVDGYLIKDGLTKEDVLKELLDKWATAPVVDIGTFEREINDKKK